MCWLGLSTWLSVGYIFFFPESPHHALVRVNQKRNQGKILKISGATTITLGYSHMVICKEVAYGNIQRSSQWVTDVAHCAPCVNSAGQSCPINTIGLFVVVITSRGYKMTEVSPWAPPLMPHFCDWIWSTYCISLQTLTCPHVYFRCTQ